VYALLVCSLSRGIDDAASDSSAEVEPAVAAVDLEEMHSSVAVCDEAGEDELAVEKDTPKEGALEEEDDDDDEDEEGDRDDDALDETT